MENNHCKGKFPQQLVLVNFVDSQMWKNPTVAASLTNVMCYVMKLFSKLFQEENPHTLNVRENLSKYQPQLWSKNPQNVTFFFFW